MAENRAKFTPRHPKCAQGYGWPGPMYIAESSYNNISTNITALINY